MNGLNPTAQLGKINAGIDLQQQNLAKTENNIQKSILGDSTISSGTLRQNLHVAAQLLAFLRESSRAWLEEAKAEQKLLRELRLGDRTDLATA